jgi:transglutaminase-like putative cysteine protease
MQPVEKSGTNVHVYQLGDGPIERGTLPPGRAGTMKTLELMRRLVRDGSHDMSVRSRAHQVLRSRGVQSHDYAGELDAVFTFVRDGVRYVRDPVGLETLQSARNTLRTGMGDCDDKATLLASMLRSIGHPADLRFRVIGTNPLSGAFGHVYVVARLGGKRIPLDPTREGTALGWEFPNPSVSAEVPA